MDSYNTQTSDLITWEIDINTKNKWESNEAGGISKKFKFLALLVPI